MESDLSPAILRFYPDIPPPPHDDLSGGGGWVPLQITFTKILKTIFGSTPGKNPGHTPALVMIVHMCLKLFWLICLAGKWRAWIT